MYSRKYDVYSFGVLILQIISGKRSSCLYGMHKNLNLLEFVSSIITFLLSFLFYFISDNTPAIMTFLGIPTVERWQCLGVPGSIT